jgi:hypothetical protein
MKTGFLYKLRAGEIPPYLFAYKSSAS